MNPAAYEAKRLNTRRIADYIISNGETSRIAISKDLGISTGTVTNIITDLMNMGLVYESGIRKNAVGRNSMILSFRSDIRYCVNAELRCTDEMMLSVTDFSGREIDSLTVDCQLTLSPDRKETDVIKDIISIIKDFISGQSDQVRKKIFALGLSIEAAIRFDSSIYAPHSNWADMSLIIPLQAAINIPVFAEGVTRVKALYEKRFFDQSEKNVIYLNLASGVGMANFFNGKMVTGRTGIAGEIGHVSLNANGPECYCGSHGCFEYYCGMRSILKRAEELMKTVDHDDVFYDMAVRKHMPVTPEMLMEARNGGSLIIHELMCDVADYLGAGLAAIYNIYDPDRVIISGYVDDMDSFIIGSALNVARSMIVDRYNREMKVSRAHLKNSELHTAISSFVLSKYLDSVI